MCSPEHIVRMALPLALALLAGCAGVADLERGKRALRQGNDISAEADLAPLARRGYVDAQLRLAKLYSARQFREDQEAAAYWYRLLLQDNPSVGPALARVLMQLGGPDDLKEAEFLLRNAEARGDPRALALLIRLLTDHPELDPHGSGAQIVARAERLDLPELDGELLRWYRAYPDDERYAARLIGHCRKAVKREPDCLLDLARYYRRHDERDALRELSATALSGHAAGRVDADLLQRVAWELADDDAASAPLPEEAFPMLEVAARKSALARVRLARLLVDQPQLDPDARPEDLLLSAAEEGNPEAELALGRLYMYGEKVQADPAKAESYLLKASKSELGAHYSLGRLYRQGLLGHADPVAAARHYLYAARHGYARADLALAELFSDNRGVRPNLANAYSFASIAARNEVPEAPDRLVQIQAQMTVEDLQEGERLVEEELAEREDAAPQTVEQARMEEQARETAGEVRERTTAEDGQ